MSQPAVPGRTRACPPGSAPFFHGRHDGDGPRFRHGLVTRVVPGRQSNRPVVGATDLSCWVIIERKKIQIDIENRLSHRHISDIQVHKSKDRC
jgi:hypothetical protein